MLFYMDMNISRLFKLFINPIIFGGISPQNIPDKQPVFDLMHKKN